MRIAFGCASSKTPKKEIVCIEQCCENSQFNNTPSPQVFTFFSKTISNKNNNSNIMEGFRICKFGQQEVSSFRTEGRKVLRLEGEGNGLKALEGLTRYLFLLPLSLLPPILLFVIYNRTNDIAKSTSFLGATHAGKSTLIRGVLGLPWEDPRYNPFSLLFAHL